MAIAHSYNHHWVRRKVEVEGTTIFHRQCVACRRDFVWDGEKGGWRAVHVGLLEFDFLDDETNRRWICEECPGRQLPEESNDKRMKCERSSSGEVA